MLAPLPLRPVCPLSLVQPVVRRGQTFAAALTLQHVSPRLSPPVVLRDASATKDAGARRGAAKPQFALRNGCNSRWPLLHRAWRLEYRPARQVISDLEAPGAAGRVDRNTRGPAAADGSLERRRRGTRVARKCARASLARLSRTKITDEGLMKVGKLTKLEGLKLGQCRITDKGLVDLAGLVSLEGLSLLTTNITVAGLDHLAGMRRLRTLNLNWTPIGNEGLKKLKTHQRARGTICLRNTNHRRRTRRAEIARPFAHPQAHLERHHGRWPGAFVGNAADRNLVSVLHTSDRCRAEVFARHARG